MVGYVSPWGSNSFVLDRYNLNTASWGCSFCGFSKMGNLYWLLQVIRFDLIV